MSSTSTHIRVIEAPATLPFNHHRVFTAFIAAPDPATGLTITLADGPPFTLTPGTVWQPPSGIMSSIELAGTGHAVVS